MGKTRNELRQLEGRQVCLALVDGSRIDDASLVSTGRGAITTLWIYTNRVDAFIQMSQIADVYERGESAPDRNDHRVA
jgi:hypothetical protein